MEHFIQVENGVKIFAHDINPQGQKTIIFMHGWPANHKMFEYQYNRLIPLGYRCVGVDTRGSGRSDKPAFGYDYNRLADDLKAVIDALGLRNVTLLGHSTGGAINIRYMARHNGFGVSKLALCAAAAPSLIQFPGFPYGQNESDIKKIIDNTYSDRPEMLDEFGENFFFSKVSDAFSEWFFSLGLEAASWSTIAVSQAWLVERLFSDLGKIKVPTLIMQGIHDKIVPYPLSVILKDGIEGSRLITFENSGHGLFYDEVDKFNTELISFIG